MSVQREQISVKYTATTQLGHTHVAVMLVSSLMLPLEEHALVSSYSHIIHLDFSVIGLCLLSYCNLYLQISMNVELVLTIVSKYVTIQ